jgi:hypothetical protein
MVFTFAGYYENAEFEVECKLDIDFSQYDYIQFSSKNGQKAVFNFYKIEMQQGEKVNAINSGRKYIQKTGFYDMYPQNPSWKMFGKICPCILYSFEVKKRTICITPLDFRENGKLYANGEPRILRL